MSTTIAEKAMRELTKDINEEINNYFSTKNILFIRCTNEEFKNLELLIFKQEYPEYLSDILVKHIIITVIDVDIPQIYTYKLINNNGVYMYVTRGDSIINEMEKS